MEIRPIWSNSKVLVPVGFAAFFLCLSGMRFLGQHPRINVPTTNLPSSRIVGIGLNCHAEKLPLPDVKALGVSWVRLDLPGRLCTRDRMAPLVDYYRDFGQLWILPSDAPDKAATAKLMKSLGITEIEVFNEPELAKISAESYAISFQIVRGAVLDGARLYGPTIGTWAQQKTYLDACINAGARPDVLSFHGYLQKNPGELTHWVKEAKTYGAPVVISELGYPTYLGQMPYRVSMRDSLASLFVKTRRALGATPWCWYDGPNPAGDNDAGLFDWDSRAGYRPNQNYRDLAAALKADSH